MEKENKKEKLIIAGPCAIETEEQFYKTVESIYNFSDIIRAGIWKGRTSPKDYPGVGKKGLSWAQNIQKKYNIPIALEIGCPRHLELALEHDLRIFWLGARTTTNPFSIQELAEACRGSNIEIWIKNPLVSDVKLWLGAIERFEQVNIKNIKAIHRGFHSETKINYRNKPRWDLLTRFKKEYPNMPVICDPSHISGDKKYIFDLAKKAYKKDLDGLMVEVHCLPQNALSDKYQQLSPKEFKQLLYRLNQST